MKIIWSALYGGIFEPTTELAPITAPSPIWTPGNIVTFWPIHTSLPIAVSPLIGIFSFIPYRFSFPDLVRDLVRPRKTVRINEAFLLLMGKLRVQPFHISPDVESVVNGSLRKRIHLTAHIPALPCVGEEPVLPFQLFGEGSRGRRDPHDDHKDGEAEPG